MPSFNIEVTLSGVRSGGAGDAFLSKVVPFTDQPSVRFNENVKGVLEGNSVRATVGSVVSAIDYTMSHRDTELSASIPAEKVITTTPSIALTPSADTPDLDQDLDFPKRFEGVVRVGGNITFTGNGDFSFVFGLSGTID